MRRIWTMIALRGPLEILVWAAALAALVASFVLRGGSGSWVSGLLLTVCLVLILALVAVRRQRGQNNDERDR